MKINFIDFYSTMTACECIPCSLEDFEGLQHVLSEARQRLEDEEELALCLALEHSNGELFISAPDYFDDDSLPDNVRAAIGRMLRLSGKEFLECEYSQTASKIAVNSHGGGVFRIYNDGTLVRPEIVWPS